jgi:hypothetical protein
MILGFDSEQGQESLLFTKMSRLAVGPTHPPVQWVSGAHVPWGKWLEPEADRSCPSSANVKIEWCYTPYSPIYTYMVRRGLNLPLILLPMS